MRLRHSGTLRDLIDYPDGDPGTAFFVVVAVRVWARFDTFNADAE
jgi:hypothetical protein